MHMNHHGISFLLIFKPLLLDDQRQSYEVINKGEQYSDYNTYLLKRLGRILQLRVGYYIRPNTLEFSAEYSEQNESNFRFIR